MRSLSEILRRCYHDLVKGRSSVRVVEAGSGLQNQFPPIFVVGVYRSGTTMLRYILDSHSQICCPPETDFLLPLSQLTSEPRATAGLHNMGFDEQHVAKKLRELSDYFFLNYSQTVNKRRWADKTPGYIDCLDFISEIYPDAQYLMLYRHGLDQAHSMTRGGTYQRDVFKSYCQNGEDFRVGATRYWNEKVSLMLEFEKRLGDQCHRILYESLCESPAEIVQPMFQFLNERFEPETLEYSKFPHTFGKEDGRAMAAKKVKPASRHYLDWPQDLRDQCFEAAESNLSQLGYCPNVIHHTGT